MPAATFPGDEIIITVTGTYKMMNGVAAGGGLTFTPDPNLAELRDPNHKLIIVPEVLAADLDNAGFFTIDLPATNAPGIIPGAFTYRVKVNLNGSSYQGGQQNYEFDLALPFNAAGHTIDLSTVTAATTLPDVSGYVLVSDFQTLQDAVTSLAQTVAGLGGGGGGGGSFDGETLTVLGLASASAPNRYVGIYNGGPPADNGQWLVGDFCFDGTTPPGWICRTASPAAAWTHMGTYPASVAEAFAIAASNAYTDAQIALLPSLVSSDPSMIHLLPAVGGAITMDLTGLQGLAPRGVYLVTEQDFTNTTIGNINGLSLPVLGNRAYKVQADIVYSADAAGDARLAWATLPVGANLGFWTPDAFDSTAAADFGPVKRPAHPWNTASLILGGIGDNVPVVAKVTGTFICGASGGTLQLTASQSVASATPVRIFPGSSLMLTPLV